MSTPATFPAGVVPMPSQVGCILGDRHGVSRSDGNLSVASGACVFLHGFVWLHAPHLHVTVETVPDVTRHGQPKNPHATSANAAIRAATTNTMSVRRATRLRVGSNPTRQTYGRDGG